MALMAALSTTLKEWLNGKGMGNPFGRYASKINLGTRLEDLANLASTSNAKGASLIGIEDADALYTGEQVEAALKELGLVRQYRATGTITNTQLRALFTTPITVIAAPGAGKMIRVVSVKWFLDYTAPAFDAADAADALTLKYTNASGAQVVDSVAGDVIGAASADYHSLQNAVAEVVPVANAAIVAHILNSEWYGAAGGSVLKYEIRYEILSADPT